MRRSLLYVPGVEERKVRKAPQVGADVIIFDLEDSVPWDRKEEARGLLERILSDTSYVESVKSEVCVRINSLSTPESFKDLALVSRLEGVSCIVVPKAELRLDFIYRATGKTVMAIVETARGFLRLDEVASSEGVEALLLGVADLALDVGGSLASYESNVYVRTELVIKAKAYGLEAVDKVYFNIDDLEGLRRDAMEAKALGYTGKQVVHPNQVPVVNEVFKPTEEELEWARRVVEEYEKAAREGRGAVRVEGRLVDHVHYRIAKRILEHLERAARQSRQP